MRRSPREMILVAMNHITANGKTIEVSLPCTLEDFLKGGEGLVRREIEQALEMC